MTNTFVFTNRGDVNLGAVKKAYSTKDGSWDLEVGDGVISGASEHFPDTLVSIITPQGEWGCLTIDRSDGNPRVKGEPVLAWGLTAGAKLVPVTASWPEGVQVDFALRLRSRYDVYTAYGRFDDAQAWLRDVMEDEAK